MYELIYTSSRQGLKPGTSGFCSVAWSMGTPPNLIPAIEKQSSYKTAIPAHDPEAPRNPVCIRYQKLSYGSKRLYVISRVCFAGFDYTRRSNMLAHHLFFDKAGELAAIPGGAVGICLADGNFHKTWEGESRLLQPRTPLTQPLPEGIQARTWQDITGDAGWAGAIANLFLKRTSNATVEFHWSETDAETLLRLVAEVINLLPPDKRDDFTFSTYFTQAGVGVDCFLRFCLSDETPARAGAPSHRTGTLLSLRTKSKLPPSLECELAESARSGHPPPEPEQPLKEAVPEQPQYSEEPTLKPLPPVRRTPPPAKHRKKLPEPVPENHDLRRKLLFGAAALLILSIIPAAFLIFKPADKAPTQITSTTTPETPETPMPEKSTSQQETTSRQPPELPKPKLPLLTAADSYAMLKAWVHGDSFKLPASLKAATAVHLTLKPGLPKISSDVKWEDSVRDNGRSAAIVPIESYSVMTEFGTQRKYRAHQSPSAAQTLSVSLNTQSVNIPVAEPAGSAVTVPTTALVESLDFTGPDGTPLVWHPEFTQELLDRLPFGRFGFDGWDIIYTPSADEELFKGLFTIECKTNAGNLDLNGRYTDLTRMLKRLAEVADSSRKVDGALKTAQTKQNIIKQKCERIQQIIIKAQQFSEKHKFQISDDFYTSICRQCVKLQHEYGSNWNGNINDGTSSASQSALLDKTQNSPEKTEARKNLQDYMENAAAILYLIYDKNDKPLFKERNSKNGKYIITYFANLKKSIDMLQNKVQSKDMPEAAEPFFTMYNIVIYNMQNKSTPIFAQKAKCSHEVTKIKDTLKKLNEDYTKELEKFINTLKRLDAPDDDLAKLRDSIKECKQPVVPSEGIRKAVIAYLRQKLRHGFVEPSSSTEGNAK